MKLLGKCNNASLTKGLCFVKVGFGLMAIDKDEKIIFDMGSTYFGYNDTKPETDNLLDVIESHICDGDYTVVITHPHFDHYNLLYFAIDTGHSIMSKIKKLVAHDFPSDNFQMIINYFGPSNYTKVENQNKFNYKINGVTGITSRVSSVNSRTLNRSSINCMKGTEYYISGDQVYKNIEANIQKVYGISARPVCFDQFQIPHHGGHAGKSKKYGTTWMADIAYLTWYHEHNHGIKVPDIFNLRWNVGVQYIGVWDNRSECPLCCKK